MMTTSVLPKSLQGFSRWSAEAPVTARENASTATSAQPADVLRLGVVLAIAHVLLLAGRSVVSSAADLYPLAQGAHPYFVPGHFLLLYVLSPVVVLSTCIVLLGPGLLLALAAGYTTTLANWVLYAFPASLALLTVSAAVVQAVRGAPLVGNAFIAVNAACTLLALLPVIRRLRSGGRVLWPARCATSLSPMLAFPAVILIALTPKFYWENFNGDGVHAFESARLLLHQALPFWNPAAGPIAAFPGVTSMLFAFPGSWFVRLFGNIEAAARLPYLLYLVLVFAGISTLIDYKRSRPAPLLTTVLIWGALVVYTIVVAFSATYSPYAADIALPATQDTLLVACFLGFISAFLDRRFGYMAVFALLTHLSLPNGLLMLGFWTVAVVMVFRPVPWRLVAYCGLILLGCVAVSAMAPRILAALHVPVPGNEYGIGGLVHRVLDDMRLTSWRRFAFMAVPCGILPAIGLLFWRWQDDLARVLTLVTAALFLFFYVQAGTALHYYIPVMLLPLAVYWRLRPMARVQRAWLSNSVTAGALLVSAWLSLPASPAIDNSARMVGSAFAIRGSDYNDMRPAAFAVAGALHLAFPYDWSRAVPDTSYGGSPLVWNHYAHRDAGTTTAANYIVQPAADGMSEPARLVGAKSGWALYVRSDSVWQAHRHMRTSARAGAPLYAIPRAQLFR